MRESVRSLRLLFGTAYATSPVLTIAAMLLTPFAGATAQLSGLWLKVLADSVIDENRTAALAAGWLLAGSVGVGVIAGRFAFELRQTLSERVQAAVEARVIAIAASIPTIEHHERPEFHDKLELLRGSIGNMGSAMAFVPEALAIGSRFIVASLLLASVHPLLLLLPLLGVPPLLVGTATQRRTQRAQEVTAPTMRLSRHYFRLGIDPGAGKELRVFNLQRELQARHTNEWWRAFVAVRRTHRLAIIAAAAASLSPTGGFVAALAFSSWRVINGAGSPGDILLAATLAVQVQEAVGEIRWYVLFLQNSAHAAKRYLWFVDYHETFVSQTPAPLSDAPNEIVDAIEFRDVCFAYPGTDRVVLRDVNLRLVAGSVIALVGDNGAGKTTLVKLLCRLYEPSGGTISVDGLNLSSIQPEQWRARMTGAFQDFARLEFVAQETVGVGDLPRVADPTAAMTALDRAGAPELPGRLPAGLSTQLGGQWDGGVELSIGQWQKLALGRALMNDTPLVYVFDEPTASLDAQTEHHLFERFAASSRQPGSAAADGAVTLLVSHRFSTVRMADHIVVISDGRVVEQGSHEALLASGGLYAELYTLQATGYR